MSMRALHPVSATAPLRLLLQTRIHHNDWVTSETIFTCITTPYSVSRSAASIIYRHPISAPLFPLPLLVLLVIFRFKLYVRIAVESGVVDMSDEA
jgi:hypothetical protein